MNKTKVCFLINETDKEAGKEVFAFFPFLKESPQTFLSYSHIGQHSQCSLAYALESREATMNEAGDLYKELVSIGYDLELVSFGEIKKLKPIKNAYDLANEIIESKETNPEKYQLAKTFLDKYNELGDSIGDCDNPFNPVVAEITDLEADFLEAINQ